MNFSPEMFQNMKNMMNPGMMKNMTDMIQNMSDDELRRISAMSGQNLSPEMMRMAANQMKNMKDDDIERIKNSSVPNPNINRNNNNSTSFNNNPPNSSNTQKPQPNNETQNPPKKSAEFTPKKNLTPIEKLEKIKVQGNDFYKHEKHKEAYEKYYECLNEIEFLSSSDKEKYKKEISEIDMNCRLNITAVKLKLEDYDLVIYECNKILQITENWKAHYRAGVAYYKKGKYKQALHHFDKYKNLNPSNDEKTVENYINHARREVQLLEKEETDSQTKSVVENTVKENEVKVSSQQPERKEETNKFQENSIKQESNTKEDVPQVEERKIEENHQKPTSKKEYLKKVLENEGKPKERKEENDDQPEISTVDNNKEQIYEEKPVYSQQSNPDTKNLGFDDKMINDYKQKIDGMNDQEMNFMIESFKNMDNNTIKSIFSMKGQNMTDEQINMMKMQMNPNLLKMAAKSNFGGNTGSNYPPSNSYNPSSSHTHSANCSHMTNQGNGQASVENNNVGNNTKMPAFPQNMDFSSMMNFMQQNPELIKNFMGNSNMAGLFGKDNNAMMSSMSTVLWLIGIPGRIKAFLNSFRGRMLILFVIILIISYFYR